MRLLDSLVVTALVGAAFSQGFGCGGGGSAGGNAPGADGGPRSISNSGSSSGGGGSATSSSGGSSSSFDGGASSDSGSGSGDDARSSASDSGSIITAGPGCGLAEAAFCETYDAPAGIGNRSGALNGTVWGTSRASGGGNNLGQGTADAWGTTPEVRCGTTSTVEPEGDINICDGHMVEAVNDNHDVTGLAMYPKQPFDIAGRMGTVVFDVSDDSDGTHRAWPEFWYTDKPIPVPLIHDTSWISVPKDGLGIQLAGSCVPNQGCGACPGVAPYYRVGFSSAFVIRDYVVDTFGAAYADSRTTLFDCVAEPTSPGELNHFEIHLSQNQIDIYGTDAGTTTPLKHLVNIANTNLTITRGLIWIVDDHYNGNKDGTDPNPPTIAQGIHTFTWDNVGFDGPVLPRDLAFDVMDSLTPVNAGAVEDNGYPSVNLGWSIVGTASQTLTVKGVTGIEQASGAIITLNYHLDPEGGALTYSLNGKAPHVQAWPYPDTNGSSWRTIDLPVPLSDIVAGTNTIRLSADSGTNDAFFANVDLILVGAAGVPR